MEKEKEADKVTETETETVSEGPMRAALKFKSKALPPSLANETWQDRTGEKDDMTAMDVGYSHRRTDSAPADRRSGQSNVRADNNTFDLDGLVGG